jgi:hypothetical protein
MTRGKVGPCANRERISQDDLLEKILAVLWVYRGVVRATILKNLGLLTCGMLTLFSGARGGNGGLSQAAVARCMPLESGAKQREQRLGRFLGNPRLTPEVLIPLYVAIVRGMALTERMVMVLDQTTIRGIETLLMGLVYEGRVLPVGFSCFTYGLIQKSQNILEHSLIVVVMSCFPVESRPLLVMDRGYARVALLQKLRLEGIPYLIRAKKNVVVYVEGKAQALGRFAYKVGQPRCYRVLYHSKAREVLDLIVFHGKGYKEPWYLLVPVGIGLTAQEVVELYAQRMSIEQGFRDWKTHLGVRGLVFHAKDPAPRLMRLLLGFTLSYLLCLALGATEQAQSFRAFVEIPRATPRHGTTRTLSVLTVGILRLSLPRATAEARRELMAILGRLVRG